jgi:CHAT domain-containing protein
MWEIYELQLNADMVVLSACRTARGKEISGEGVMGLIRAFLFAGTHSVVASLWNVPDESTATLMEHFYAEAREEDTDKAEALRRARIELMKTYPHPFYWAPFILVGER